MTSIKDIYWLAGILEGEGTFGTTNKSATFPRIQLRMSDGDVIMKAARLMGQGESVKYRTFPAPRRPQYGFQVAGQHAAAWMMTIYALMGQRRQARIREILLARSGTRGWKRRPKLPAHLTVPEQPTPAA